MSATAFPMPQALTWRHPEWWVLALSALAWGSMLQPHAHHRPPLVQWMAMTAAMMFPLVARAARMTAERSLWRRRHRAMLAFLLGYTACWLLFGVTLVALRLPARREFAVAALAVAGAWQLTRVKRLALAACHYRMPLAPRGWRADRDCVSYGWQIGARCVISCWAIMLACFLAGHSLPAMLGLASIVTIERFTRKPNHVLLASALFAGALALALYS